MARVLEAGLRAATTLRAPAFVHMATEPQGLTGAFVLPNHAPKLVGGVSLARYTSIPCSTSAVSDERTCNAYICEAPSRSRSESSRICARIESIAVRGGEPSMMAPGG